MVHLSAEFFNKKQAEVQIRGGAFWRPKDGRNVVRLLPFVSAALHGKACLERKWLRHYISAEKRTETCGKSPARNGEVRAACALCDQADKFPDARMNASDRRVMNVIPIITGGTPEQTLRVVPWEAPAIIFDQIIGLLRDAPDPGAWFGVNGRDFRVTYDSKAHVSRMFQSAFLEPSVEMGYSRPLDPGLQAQAADLFAEDKYEPSWFLQMNQQRPAAPQPQPQQAAPPPPVSAPKPTAPQLPEGWKAHQAPDGRTYYEKPDGSTTWDLPASSRFTPTSPTPNPAPTPVTDPSKYAVKDADSSDVAY